MSFYIMLKRLLQDNIKIFNKNWNKSKAVICHLPNYVEQYMYIYDSKKIYQDNNGYDNLELYAELLQRLDISNLRMMWVKLDDDSCFFVCIFKEKNDYYLEYKTNGVHKKVWLSMWIQNTRIVEKKRIEVEIIWS